MLGFATTFKALHGFQKYEVTCDILFAKKKRPEVYELMLDKPRKKNVFPQCSKTELRVIQCTACYVGRRNVRP